MFAAEIVSLLLFLLLARVASNRSWIRWPLIVGSLAVVATGLFLALALAHDSSVILLILVSVLFGVTNGLSNFANQTTLYTQSPAETIAVAAGLFRTFGYIGAIFSSSLIGLAFGDRATDSGLRPLDCAGGGADPGPVASGRRDEVGIRLRATRRLGVRRPPPPAWSWAPVQFAVAAARVGRLE